MHATFDHKLLVAEDDPARPEFVRLRDLGLAELQIVPGTSCGCIASYVLEHTQPMIAEATKGRCRIAAVECFEHGANRAIYENPKSVLRQVTAEALGALLEAAD